MTNLDLMERAGATADAANEAAGLFHRIIDGAFGDFLVVIASDDETWAPCKAFNKWRDALEYCVECNEWLMANPTMGGTTP